MSAETAAIEDRAADTATMWRCEACGKWSHAKRRPAHHERFVAGCVPIVAEQRGLVPSRGTLSYQTSYGEDDDSGMWVQCGPFGEWTATRERGNQ